VQKVTLEINNSIYEYIMFFLENIPNNLLSIKKEIQEKVDGLNLDEKSDFDKAELLNRINDIRYNKIKPLSREEVFRDIC
jgi:hypothetical protein